MSTAEIPYRWLTLAAVIEPLTDRNSCWQIICRRTQTTLGQLQLNSDLQLHCTIDSSHAAYGAVISRAAQQLGIESAYAADLVTSDTGYVDAITQCCVELKIPGDYGLRHQLPVMSEPDSLRLIGPDVFDRPQYLAPNAHQQWLAMVAAADDEGVTLQAVSAFRDYHYQANLIGNKLERGTAIEQILTVNTAPGYSEHHTGRAIDITAPGSAPLELCFADTDAFRWLSSHAGQFGFVLSYPMNNAHGLSYEPWHWCWRAEAGTTAIVAS